MSCCHKITETASCLFTSLVCSVVCTAAVDCMFCPYISAKYLVYPTQLLQGGFQSAMRSRMPLLILLLNRKLAIRHLVALSEHHQEKKRSNEAIMSHLSVLLLVAPR